MPAEMALSIVVPTLNEEASLPALLGDLASLAGSAAEVVVADGGSTDETVRLAASLGARVVTTAPGRGVQLRAGVAATQAPHLLILHADVRLPPPALQELRETLGAGVTGPWAFRLAIDAPEPKFRLIESAANFRSRLFHLPYGDQGLLIRRAHYDRVGGFPSVVLMEDVALALALRRISPIRLLRSSILVSARRWAREGVLVRSTRNLVLLARYLAGARPQDLSAEYKPAARD